MSSPDSRNGLSPRRATINDVAQLAGVSIKTVSRVFNQEPHVRPSTHEKVIAAAKTLDYQPNPSARQLASQLTFVVGMLYDNPNSDYVTGMQYGSLQACREFFIRGMNFLCLRLDRLTIRNRLLEPTRQLCPDGFCLLHFGQSGVARRHRSFQPL